MPSRHRMRYASTSSAPQALLNINNQNNLKASSSTSSASVLASNPSSVSSSSASASTSYTSSSSLSSSRGGAGNSLTHQNHIAGGTNPQHNHPSHQQSSPSYLGNGLVGGGGGLGGGGAAGGSGGGASSDDKQVRQAYLLTLTKEQLKVECRKRGQKTNGNRFELLQRLGVKMSQLQKKNQQHTDNSPRNRKNNGNMDSNTKSSPTSVGTQQQPQKKANGSPNGSPPQQQQQQQHEQQQQQQQNVMKKKSQKTNRDKEREEREQLVLLRSPIQTIKYCSLELVTLTQIYGKKLLQHRTLLTGFLVLAVFLSVLYNIPGRHQIVIEIIRKNTWFFVYWTGLGILSSVGLGTGLHTFLLYLGPHIASVTLAAYECNALNFPKPPYPDDIICPDESDLSHPPNLWNIMRKVRLEAFLWGAGTALGELPPYFMAKAARLSGYDPEDAEDLAAFEELKAKKNQKDLGLIDRGKLFMERVVERIGFFGILACASIPNPLFDLAGITCGHFLVPFWKFFGATLIGKAVIKMHIQKIFVIIAFNESLLERAVDLLQAVPVFGKKLQEPFKGFLENQKHRLHRQRSSSTESGNLLSKIFEKFVICMVCYFVMSIVNSLAQSYHKRIHKKAKKVMKKVAKD